jgi:DNA-binding transcriptional ArsR family regulator
MSSFAALADPTRRRIVEMLASRDRSAGEIAQHFSVSASAISQHLKILREARLVKVRVDGQHRIHSLNPEGMEEVESWIARTKRFWESRLDALERELRAEDERNRARKKK